MLPENQPAEHDNPEIERRLVRIGQTVVGESENVPVGNGLVRNAQVTQLIGGREIPQQHRRKQADECEYEYKGERILLRNHTRLELIPCPHFSSP